MANSPTPTDESPNRANARRRRAQRQVVPSLTPDEKTTYIETVARKAAPSFDFFLFSLLCGAILGIGFLFNSPYLLVLGGLTAPLMSPVLGVSLGTVLGSGPYFGRSLGGFSIGSFLLLLSSALAGLLAKLFSSGEFVLAQMHAQLDWPPFIVIGIASVLLAANLVHENGNSHIPSAALAYSLFVPLASAGFGLGSGLPFIWPAGLVLFAIHLAWAVLLGAVTLAWMGFRPYSLFGYSIGGVVALAGIIMVIGFSGAGAVVGANIALPTHTATLPPSPTATLPPTHTLPPPTSTQTATATKTSTLTATFTLTPSPTSVEARVKSKEGAVLRDKPNGKIISTLFDSSLVEVTGVSQLDEFNRPWELVIDLENQVEGWILRNLIITATPQPTNTGTPVPGSATPEPPAETATTTPSILPATNTPSQ
ncbi:MAG: DUF389 domain-containing protein [Anaerolineae bacterium]|nr:DUF389 domain-containing protein [Anaerolineae bacterium]